MEAAMFELERFIEDCHIALGEQSPVSAMNELMQRTVSEPGAIEQALGAPERGGITVLHRSLELTVLNVVWAPEMRANPHNHCMWAVIGVYGGQEDNSFYRRSEHRLEQMGERLLSPRDTLVLGEHGIHSVFNSIPRFTGGIHVYGGDFFAADRRIWDPETFEEKAFDAETTMRSFEDANERWLAKQGQRSEA
jgi:predicted metal-dependent enzyme (double-stranded beta helix superfamily)